MSTLPAVEPQTFEIGLVLAGAVSAGAYTAGVIDVLLEKLQAFEDYKAAHAGEPTCPKHKVVIKVISGASAGAMTGVLAAANIAGEPVANGSSRLHKAWVEEIDISKLLQTRDLDGNKPVVQSLMDCTALDEITSAALDLTPRQALPPFVANPLHLYLSVSNLRGVPYGLSAGGHAAGHAHEMLRHGDRMHFAIVDSNEHPEQNQDDDAVPLARGKLSPNDERWKLFGESALASGAFPMGLKPRTLRRKTTDYDVLKWSVPKDNPEPGPDGKCECSELVTVKPLWPDEMLPEYSFLNVDGGLINNEPLELAREELAGIGGRNPRDPNRAHRAVLMVDPFPDPVAFGHDYEPKPDIISVATQMFSALKMQARFKPDELRLAGDTETFSRFLIAPTRSEPDGTKTLPAITSDTLGAFGGFLSRTFREHDYRLGRRNCEAFLKKWFRLHVDNPVFDGWRDTKQERDLDTRDGAIPTLPIIPIDNPTREENLLPYRPRSSDVDMEVLKKGIKTRVDRVGKLMIAEHADGFFGSIAKLAWTTWPINLRSKVVKFAVDKIEEGLKPLG